jgi:hypothetical protein
MLGVKNHSEADCLKSHDSCCVRSAVLGGKHFAAVSWQAGGSGRVRVSCATKAV